ncbi:hypothetical protein C461_15015 [Halorubrum aidingense JCM 13560]|uniref:Uncharacterized protein n=1 Tax=Halorubrum aidingense JCM 13560 TaxID=1230454 RepID=M0P5R4_9EURY|nr:UPF0146 family protein [Halorubrum aidingense]EMA65163.1 hypothetical protein C461_15015 [Halorubrum aidingense JCM 13560]
MVSSSRRVLVPELASHDRLLEVGVGNRPGVASALAERGADVVAIDVDVGERTRRAARAHSVSADADEGSLRAIEADVFALDEADDAGINAGADARVDAVYALNLPAELQRPTAALAARLDADCLFTTLGFEEPVVPVDRRSLSGATLYVVRDRKGRGPGSR